MGSGFSRINSPEGGPPQMSCELVAAPGEAADHGAAGDGMQDLGELRFHSRPLPRRQDYDVSRRLNHLNLGEDRR